MTLRNRVHAIERRTGTAHKDPNEMTMPELWNCIVLSMEREPDRVQSLLCCLPDDVLQRQTDRIRHAIETDNMELLCGAEMTAFLEAVVREGGQS
jgi:hypothetical protein